MIVLKLFMDIVYLYFFDSHGMSREKESLRGNEVALGGGRQVKAKLWRLLRIFILLGVFVRFFMGDVVCDFIRFVC